MTANGSNTIRGCKLAKAGALQEQWMHFFSGVWYYSLAPTLCDITSDLQVWQKEGGVHLKCAWFLPFGVWRIQQKLGELRRQSVLLVSFLQAL